VPRKLNTKMAETANAMHGNQIFAVQTVLLQPCLPQFGDIEKPHDRPMCLGLSRANIRSLPSAWCINRLSGAAEVTSNLQGGENSGGRSTEEQFRCSLAEGESPYGITNMYNKYVKLRG
jgi:hypothetical protein